jgi:hypothetical protein
VAAQGGSIGPLWVQLSLVREYRARVERALASLVPEADRSAHQEMKLYAALGRDHASTWLRASDDLHEWLSRGHRQKEWGFKPSAAGREEGESLFGKEATKAVSKRWPILRRVSQSGSGIRTPGRGEFGEIAVPLRRELLARIDDSVSAPSDGHVYRPRDLYHGCGLPGTLTRKL